MRSICSCRRANAGRQAQKQAREFAQTEPAHEVVKGGHFVQVLQEGHDRDFSSR
jgi:hypothetical protein